MNANSSAGASEAKALAAILAGIGALHFASPKMFDESIPAELPGNPRIYTHVSGVVEYVIAGGLLVPKTRSLAGLVAAAFFVAVFPANLNTVRIWWQKPMLRAFAIARLPLQIPLIVAAVRVWRRARFPEYHSDRSR
ncbi:membrane protein [Mycobacterium avium subsp. hominissuis 10-5606]|nr:membrane protein [Mycobacterium avium subsp. hominissuis 10-5606]